MKYTGVYFLKNVCEYTFSKMYVNYASEPIKRILMQKIFIFNQLIYTHVQHTKP